MLGSVPGQLVEGIPLHQSCSTRLCFRHNVDFNWHAKRDKCLVRNLVLSPGSQPVSSVQGRLIVNFLV